jgi:hypothetical protein
MFLKCSRGILAAKHGPKEAKSDGVNEVLPDCLSLI